MRCAEEGQDGVADVLLHHAAGPMNDLGDDGEVLPLQDSQVDGIEVPGQAGETHDIDEEHAHGTTFLTRSEAVSGNVGAGAAARTALPAVAVTVIKPVSTSGAVRCGASDFRQRHQRGASAGRRWMIGHSRDATSDVACRDGHPCLPVTG